MNGKEVDAALKRASRNKTGSTPTPEEVEKYLRSYKSNLFPTKIRKGNVMKEKLHVKNENGYSAYYIVYQKYTICTGNYIYFC